MKLHLSLRSPQPLLFSAILAAVAVLAPPPSGDFLGGPANQQAYATAPIDPPPTAPDPAESVNREQPRPAPTDPSGGEIEGDKKATGDAPVEAADAKRQRATRFATYMTGATLAGRFTVEGKPNGEMPEEEYTIIKCEKLPDGDLFRFTARIRYGETDLELPMDLPVYWAGDTPVISLTNLWIPGLGTFSSRVMIYRDQYAGTWKHGEAGGHMFGVIKKEE